MYPHVLALLWLAQVLPGPAVTVVTASSTPSTARAIYIITNDAANAVVAVPVAANGMLSGGTCTATGGAGSNSINGATNEPAAPDALVSQSALTVAGNVRFTTLAW